MNQHQDYQKDLASIRDLMERSVKFISLSGLSGILAGLYALAGAAVAYSILRYPVSRVEYQDGTLPQDEIIWKLIAIAAVVLTVSVATGFVLSSRKAKKQGAKIWNATSRRMLFNLLIPLVTGGVFILMLLYHGYYGLIAPSFLIFYGLALVTAGPNMYEEVRYLGYSEIILGLVATGLPGFGLLFWSIGFGAFHIFYGAIMFRKYDK